MSVHSRQPRLKIKRWILLLGISIGAALSTEVGVPPSTTAEATTVDRPFPGFESGQVRPLAISS
ncbi:MAG TPA: hypothetical protein VJ302_33685, partial [Blastocatellia bacterium]|nr:hypothetical protein [Blastocatellia bacterium]